MESELSITLMKLAEVTEQRDTWANLWADLSRACVKDTVKLEREAVTLTEQRDRLAEVLRLITNGTSCRECGGEDQALLARESLQSLTTNEL